MNKTSLVSAAAGLLALAGVCAAQPPGITPEMIASALPLEGAPLAVPGPTRSRPNRRSARRDIVVFRPTNLDAFPKKDSLPVMVWGNGGCAIDSTRYGGFLTTIASHGFLVMGTAALEGAPRRQANADDLRAAIDWAGKENARDGSPLKGKIALDKVAVMGQSCGGFLSVALGADPRVKTIGVFNSGVQPASRRRGAVAVSDRGRARQIARARAADQRPRTRLHDGGLRGNLREDRRPAGVLRRPPQCRPHRDGLSPRRRRVRQCRVELAEVAFKGDKKAGRMFVGKNCDLCTNSNWDTRSKGLVESNRLSFTAM